MPNQTTRTRKAKRETVKAEDAIRAATEAIANGETPPTKPKRSAITKQVDELGITAEAITAQRDGAGRSWAIVAKNLGLASPGAARNAYTLLTGRPHHESGLGKRAPRGSGAARKVDAPAWHDDSDQTAIEERLNGTWVEETGSGASYVPARWTGSNITVARTLAGGTYNEEVRVCRTLAFSYGKGGDQPLQVDIVADNGATRTFRVADIAEVR